jgi:hypothetical protein
MAISSQKFTQMGSPWEQVRNITLSSGPSFEMKGSSDPIRKFNTGLMELLTRYQKLGTAKWQGMALDAQGQQAERTLAETPESQRTFAPEQQGQMRAAKVASLQPAVEAGATGAQTIQEQLGALATVLDQARQISATMAEQELAEKQFQQEMAYKRAALSQSGSEAKQQYDWTEVNGKLYRVNPYTGELVDTGIGAGEASTILESVGQYKNAGYTRQDIEGMYTAEGGAVPDGVRMALDKTYGPIQWKPRFRIGPFNIGRVRAQ